mmetsp:Transcript_33134/g.103340  ORF Transcript_33134/g.103340 Transcript_33134/m.103340 type:complete len:88 (-) Transcript_33134:70-333(-)
MPARWCEFGVASFGWRPPLKSFIGDDSAGGENFSTPPTTTARLSVGSSTLLFWVPALVHSSGGLLRFNGGDLLLFEGIKENTIKLIH